MYTGLDPLNMPELYGFVSCIEGLIPLNMYELPGFVSRIHGLIPLNMYELYGFVYTWLFYKAQPIWVYLSYTASLICIFLKQSSFPGVHLLYTPAFLLGPSPSCIKVPLRSISHIN